MLYLVLNRFVLLFWHLVGIFVFVGMVACVATNKTLEITETTEKWWGRSPHMIYKDNVLLGQDVKLDQCINENMELQNWTVKPPFNLGAWVHPQNTRKKNWNNKPFSNDSVALSIVPYIQKGGKFTVVPYFDPTYQSEPDAYKPFDAYYVACKPFYQMNSSFNEYPHYYPTIMFTFFEVNKTKLQEHQEQLFTGLGNISTHSLSTNLASLEVTKTTMGDLIKKIFSNNKAENVPLLQKLNVPFKVIVKPAGFKGDSAEKKLSWIRFPDKPSDNLTDVAQVSTDNTQNDQTKEEGKETSTPYVPNTEAGGERTEFGLGTTTRHNVTITLPNNFVRIFRYANNTIIDYMRLNSCATPTIGSREKETTSFVANCSASPTSLTIVGFKPISIAKSQAVNGVTTFNITDTNRFKTKEITIFSNNDYSSVYYKDSERVSQHCGTSETNGRLSFPFKCIGKDLFVKDSALSRCVFKGDKQISLALLQTHSPRLSFSCHVDLVLPPKWSQSIFPNNVKACQYEQYLMNWRCSLPAQCFFPKGAKKWRCQLSAQDIKSEKKRFQIDLGLGWEPVMVSIDIKRGNHTITGYDLRPHWPFATGDKWWQWANVQDNATPSCEQTPHYAIQSVTYSKTNSTTYTLTKQVGEFRGIRLTKQKLPTLQEMGWYKDWPLPDTIALTIKQQPYVNKKYRREVDDPIVWKLSDVLGYSPWKLSDKFLDKLDKTTRVSLSTRSLSTDSGENYALYQFPTMNACLQSSDGTGGEPLKNVAIQHGRQLIIKPCVELNFKLIDELNGVPVSRCTQPIGNRLDFKPYACPGRRKLIVVALGEKLDPYNREIKNALVTALQQYPSVPFTLVTIRPGRELSGPLLQCEDMPDFQKGVGEFRRLIRKKVGGELRFGTRDLDAWQNLEIIDLGYQNQLNNLAGVFYVTDEAGGADINHIYKYVGIPLKWKNAGVPLTVITTGSCHDWEKNNVQANVRCQRIGQIEGALQNFLKY